MYKDIPSILSQRIAASEMEVGRNVSTYHKIM